MWPDKSSDSIYLYGGTQFDTDPSRKFFYQLQTDGNGGGSWSEVATPSWMEKSVANGYSAASGKTGFYSAGFEDDINNPQYNRELFLYDFSAGEWTRETSPVTSKGAAYGQTSFVSSYGSSGLMMTVGGTTGHTDLEDGKMGIPMDNITFYDPAAKQWHWQITTGQTPPSRFDFCAIGAGSSRGTFEM